MSERKKNYIYLPIIFSALLGIGILIGSKLNFSIGESKQINPNNKLNEVLNYIDEQYVDTINKNKLLEKTLSLLLESLDPHSSYISKEELQAMNEPLEGNFEGIGIEFSIIDDTIRVISAISGGPSEALGISAGDRIVKINNKNVAGTKITNKDVISNLRGESGTKVNVSIKRGRQNKLIDYTITRGKIPIYSIDVAYMVSTDVGYIKISRFGATTYEEFLNSMDKLEAKGMKKLILDLRGNPGGYLNAAIDISDELLSEGKMIVYTEGHSHPRKDYFAKSDGRFENEPLVVLIDEGSASASEIVSGAVQDNDRGIIIGRRSFGKGLVQEQNELPDGSALRLTIARYYTPSGRCIQKPYSDKNHDEYYDEESNRFKNGELENADSIKFNDSLKYKTLSGKTVYGGGGIMPDIFVALDTIGRSNYFNELYFTGVLNQFAFDYADSHRNELKKFRSFDDYKVSFIVNETIINSLIAYAEKNKIDKNNDDLKKSENLIKVYLKALIARNIWNNEGYFPVIKDNDKTLQRAIEELSKSK